MNANLISVDDIKRGTDFIALAVISNVSGTSDYTNLALTHIIPSGWEIYNERMLVTDTENPNSETKYSKKLNQQIFLSGYPR